MPVTALGSPRTGSHTLLVVARHADHGDDAGDEGAVLVAKVVAMLVLGLCTLLLGLLPMWLSRRLRWGGGGGGGDGGTSRSQVVLALLRALGGGALLATTFLHMLPETREALEHLQADGLIADTPFHLPETLVCAGFFMMYTVEEAVHFYLHWRERKGAPAARDEAAMHRSLSIRRCSNGAPAQGQAQAPAPQAASSSAPLAAPVAVTCGGGDTGLCEDPRLFLVTEARGDECGRLHPDYGAVLLPSKLPPGNGLVAPPPHVHVHGHSHGHSHLPPGVGGAGGGEGGVAAGLRGLLVVLALSVHELFEGLAVGLQTTAAHVYYLMGAVAAHKLVLAFCVGLELVAARTRPRLAALYVLVFAAVSPVGIGVGLALSGGGGSGDVEHGVANSVLQGLATGTLLYVVFFEVLQRERAAAAGLGLRQLAAVLAGFALMFGLLIAAGHEHDSHHDHAEEALRLLGGSTRSALPR